MSIVTDEGLTVAATTTLVVPAAASLNTAASPLVNVVAVEGGMSQLAVVPTFQVPLAVPDARPFHCRAVNPVMLRKMVEPLSSSEAV